MVITLTLHIVVFTGPPVIQELPQQVHVVFGEEFQITCTATNDQDAPTNLMFSWRTPRGVEFNETTTDEDDSRTASSTLHISNVVHSGEYKCVVGNGGTISASTSTVVVVEGECHVIYITSMLVYLFSAFFKASTSSCHFKGN